MRARWCWKWGMVKVGTSVFSRSLTWPAVILMSSLNLEMMSSATKAQVGSISPWMSLSAAMIVMAELKLRMDMSLVTSLMRKLSTLARWSTLPWRTTSVAIHLRTVLVWASQACTCGAPSATSSFSNDFVSAISRAVMHERYSWSSSVSVAAISASGKSTIVCVPSSVPLPKTNSSGSGAGSSSACFLRAAVSWSAALAAIGLNCLKSSTLLSTRCRRESLSAKSSA
mmetsp:Transcript_332/g.1165  ORF Transcript_332/g.1165 Transcript_332/m.1165 type:complete len:227 (-) Transcript_332:643-1323(-)